MNLFPNTNFHEMNLDWIIKTIKALKGGTAGDVLTKQSDSEFDYSWEAPGSGGGAVDSVNGQTGTVVLTAADVGAKPASYSAPVDSVNGQTGAVVLTAADVGAKPATYAAPVDSVNGQTGAVVLTAADVGAKPATYAAPVDSVNGQTGAVVLTIPSNTSDLNNDSGFVNASGAAAAAPVQSVAGKTGTVTLQIVASTTFVPGTSFTASTGVTMDYVRGNLRNVGVYQFTCRFSVTAAINADTDLITGFEPPASGIPAYFIGVDTANNSLVRFYLSSAGAMRSMQALPIGSYDVCGCYVIGNLSYISVQ